jgi:hypothetical protein
VYGQSPQQTAMDSAFAPLTVLPTYLEDVKIHGLPNSAYYISDFITPDEESMLLQKVPRMSLFMSYRADLNR